MSPAVIFMVSFIPKLKVSTGEITERQRKCLYLTLIVPVNADGQQLPRTKPFQGLHYCATLNAQARFWGFSILRQLDQAISLLG
jgi:hypothetical protein